MKQHLQLLILAGWTFSVCSVCAANVPLAFDPATPRTQSRIDRERIENNLRTQDNKPVAKKEEKPADNSPAGKSPVMTIADSGILFSPDVARAVKAGIKKGATEYTVAIAGPGLPMKELESPKLNGKWVALPPAKEIGVTPDQLLIQLPAYLAKNKPEVVVLVGETTGTRAPNKNERADWEDAARICRAMGAVPIYAIPQDGTMAELRHDLYDAATMSPHAAFDLKAPSTVPKRLAQMLDLLDRHVYERTPLDAPAATAKPKSPEEE
jgi:hypothetical protein